HRTDGPRVPPEQGLDGAPEALDASAALPAPRRVATSTPSSGIPVTAAGGGGRPTRTRRRPRAEALKADASAPGQQRFDAGAHEPGAVRARVTIDLRVSESSENTALAELLAAISARRIRRQIQ